MRHFPAGERLELSETGISPADRTFVLLDDDKSNNWEEKQLHRVGSTTRTVIFLSASLENRIGRSSALALAWLDVLIDAEENARTVAHGPHPSSGSKGRVNATDNSNFLTVNVVVSRLFEAVSSINFPSIGLVGETGG